MSDSLVERLRAAIERDKKLFGNSVWLQLAQEALDQIEADAARIKQLEASEAIDPINWEHALADQRGAFANHHNAMACPYCNPRKLRLFDDEHPAAEVAREFIAYHRQNGACGNCGGLPHSSTCFVGRFETVLTKAFGLGDDH